MVWLATPQSIDGGGVARMWKRKDGDQKGGWKVDIEEGLLQCGDSWASQ
jgi:hypothetical protein